VTIQGDSDVFDFSANKTLSIACLK